MKKAIKVTAIILAVLMAVNFGIYFFTRQDFELTDEWKETVEKNYAEFIAETAGTPTGFL